MKIMFFYHYFSEFKAKFSDNIPSETISKVHLVDLAGSERIAKSGGTGIRLKEGGNINKSLTTLGLVISALAENSSRRISEGKAGRKKTFVPYRDSILTWLLKESIGGNSKTIMVATVSPASIHYNETLSTLRYASRTRKIVNKPIINEDPNVKTIRELRSEIDILRKKLLERKGKDEIEDITQTKVEAKLKKNEEKADELTKHWLNKITEAQRIFQEKSISLSQQGYQTVLTSSKPHLVGLDVDPLSTDIVIYHLEEGKTVIGSCDLSDEQSIALEGSGIQAEHCDLNVTRKGVVLHSITGPTYINNQLVLKDWHLRQGDILQFGHFLRFRFHDPSEAAMLREKRKSGRFASFSDTSSGRLSPAVMHHYRSLDSGLSSPDDFEQDFSYDARSNRTNHVFNSTVVSQNSPVVSSESPSNNASDVLLLQAPCGAREYANDNGLVILRSSKDTNEQNIQIPRTLEPESHTINTNQKEVLKSSSASEVLDRASAREHFIDKEDISFRFDDSKQNEIYLSDNILHCSNLSRDSSVSADSNDMSQFSSPKIKLNQSSASDLSLSTDDLAFNFLLQSQMKQSSSTPSLDERTGHRLSLPSYNDKSKSTIDLSPRKLGKNPRADFVHSESFSILRQPSFDSEEFFVHPAESTGSMLMQEALNAADLLKEKKDQLIQLIDNYREAEINRVEIEKENMRRARENEVIFSKQQKHLEDLAAQQQSKLKEAQIELEHFQTLVTNEKENQRKTVEFEVNRLLKLKEEHLPYLDWTEHQLRKKKFKLKVKIEDYWKRMDLYETLLLDLKLERNKMKKDADDKLKDRLEKYEEEKSNEINELREQVVVSESDLESYKCRLFDEKHQYERLRKTLDMSEDEYNRKMKDAQRFCQDVKIQEASMLDECQQQINDVIKKIEDEKEKLYHYTIYKMHECSSDSCCHGDTPSRNTSVDCRIAEEKQRVILDELEEQKATLEEEYAKKVEKYASMLEHAQDALDDLGDNKLAAIEKSKNSIFEKEQMIVQLEQRVKEEDQHHEKLKSELKAYDRPRSFVNVFPQETEEDIAVSEQQIEQLLQSKNKIRKILEHSLEEEFNELKLKEELDANENDSTSVDKALSLVFHTGNTDVYIESLVKKHWQYEQRRRVLSDLSNELQDLTTYQAKLHREVAENFLTQKSLFEDVRSQERQDIHETIQTLISDDVDKDELFSRFFKESERIINQQRKLDELENQMYSKISENYTLQERLDELNTKLSKSMDVYGQNNNDLMNEYETLNSEKEKCEVLISQLQERLYEERKDYLDLLKSKDGYDVIGQEYRDERQTMVQTEGNKAAADVLREIFMAENIMDVIDKSVNLEEVNKITCGGWTYIGKEKDISLFRKRNGRSNIVSVLGRGIIKLPAKIVWEFVRNPLSRLIYDKMIKKINVVEHFTDQLKVVYMQHQTRMLLMKQRKDCCCVHNERIEQDKYIATHTSIEHPDCPLKKNYSRLKVLPSGWILEPYNEKGVDWCLAWYLVQVDVGKGYLPSFFVESIVQKLPLSILSLRDYLVLS